MQEKLKDYEIILNKAKESKHTDAVLLLIEKKPDIQNKFATIVSWVKATSENKEWREEIDKTISLVADRVYNECLNAILSDKK